MKSLSGRKTKAVALNIKNFRETANYSQEYLASRLNISQNAYSKIETGVSNITVDRLFHIAQALEIEVEELLKIGEA